MKVQRRRMALGAPAIAAATVAGAFAAFALVPFQAAYSQTAVALRTGAPRTAAGPAGPAGPACPEPPGATVAGAHVTGPTFPPPGGPTVDIAGHPHGAVCQWEVDYGGSSPSGTTGRTARSLHPRTGICPCVTSTYVGTAYMALGTIYPMDASGYYGVYCNAQGDVLNGYGGGGAQAQLDSSYCNTDGNFPGEGHVQVVGVGYSTGPYTYLTDFATTFTSFDLGNDAFYGAFEFCSENPVGQQNTYDCYFFEGGPLY